MPVLSRKFSLPVACHEHCWHEAKLDKDTGHFRLRTRKALKVPISVRVTDSRGELATLDDTLLFNATRAGEGISTRTRWKERIVLARSPRFAKPSINSVPTAKPMKKLSNTSGLRCTKGPTLSKGWS